MKSLLVVFVWMLAGLALAQPYAGKDVPEQLLAKSAGCSPPTTTTTMELNNVRMMVHTAGNLWQVPNQNYCQYEVPKNSGIMCLFTSALWLGGVDVNDQLKLAALRYTFNRLPSYNKHAHTPQTDMFESQKLLELF